MAQATAQIEPGIHHSVSREQYDAIDAVNASLLLQVRKSLAHGKAYREHPPEQTDAMRFGVALHVAFLEPDEFPREYVVFDGAVRRGKVWEAFEAANVGRRIIKAGEYDQIVAMSESLRAHPAANALFNRGGSNECTVVWMDEITGLMCKGRFDGLVTDEWPTIPDLKTTVDASPDEFPKSIARYGYHIRGSFYVDGVSQLTRHRMGPIPNYVLAAVEKEYPYNVLVCELDEQALNVGRRVYRRLLNEYKDALENDEWPGYSDTVVEIGLPKWAMRER